MAFLILDIVTVKRGRLVGTKEVVVELVGPGDSTIIRRVGEGSRGKELVEGEAIFGLLSNV